MPPERQRAKDGAGEAIHGMRFTPASTNTASESVS